jgi:hypothetical protein
MGVLSSGVMLKVSASSPPETRAAVALSWLWTLTVLPGSAAVASGR